MNKMWHIHTPNGILFYLKKDRITHITTYSSKGLHLSIKRVLTPNMGDHQAPIFSRPWILMRGNKSLKLMLKKQDTKLDWCKIKCNAFILNKRTLIKGSFAILWGLANVIQLAVRNKIVIPSCRNRHTHKYASVGRTLLLYLLFHDACPFYLLHDRDFHWVACL